MPTFLELRKKISRKLIDPNNTAISDEDVGDAVLDAINFWKFQRYWFNEAKATTTLVVNQALIEGLPDLVLYELENNGLVIPYNNLSYTIYKKPPEIYDRVSVNGVGLPYIYTWRAGSYYIYFLPNLAYTLNFYYVKDYIDLSNDTDTNDWTTNAYRLIYYDALSRLSGEDRQDSERGGIYWQKANLESENLKKRSTALAGTGQLTVDTIL